MAKASKLMMRAAHTTMLFLSLVSILLVGLQAVRDPTARSICAGAVTVAAVYFTALYALFGAWPKYTVPLRPLLYLLVVLVLVSAWNRLTARLPSNTSSPSAAAQAPAP